MIKIAMVGLVALFGTVKVAEATQAYALVSLCESVILDELDSTKTSKVVMPRVVGNQIEVVPNEVLTKTESDKGVSVELFVESFKTNDGENRILAKARVFDSQARSLFSPVALNVMEGTSASTRIGSCETLEDVGSYFLRLFIF